MNLLLLLLVIATAMNGLLAGLNLDTALVKLPARRRIGAVAYATFARGNDLGNGLGGSLHGVCHGHCLPGALLDEAALAAFLGFLAESPSHSSHHQGGPSHAEHQGCTG